VTQRPISDGLFTWPLPEPGGKSALIGARCSLCEAITFPQASGCPRCGETQMHAFELPTRGTLYTWTTQEFLPKEPYLGSETPEDFTPWAVGYVQLEDLIRVEGRLYDVDPADLDFEMPFKVVIRPFRKDEDGTVVYSFGFTPITEGG
jgi:uncharacterized OB-fold protein